MTRRLSAAAAVVLAALAGFLFIRADDGLEISQTTVQGVPLREVRQAGVTANQPGVVVAHGFAGSATLMAGFGDTLARRNFVVVLLDFSGHGANLDGPSTSESLQSDLDIAVNHLRSRPGVDPQRISLIGHSMGAGAVTRYATDHPEIASTVAISLGQELTGAGPNRLLLLVGAAEFPRFHEVASAATANADPADRRLVTVPLVEHITLPIAVTDYVIAFTVLAGALMAGIARWQKAPQAIGPGKRAMLLFPYAVLAIAVPLHLGVIHAIPSGPRWWLLALTIAGFAVFSYGALRLSFGKFWSSLAINAVAVVTLAFGAVTGLAPGFLLLIVPLFAILLAWQAGWAAILTRLGAPPWAIALTGAVLPAWPAATAMPML